MRKIVKEKRGNISELNSLTVGSTEKKSSCKKTWFFNGISTSMFYLIPKPSL